MSAPFGERKMLVLVSPGECEPAQAACRAVGAAGRLPASCWLRPRRHLHLPEHLHREVEGPPLHDARVEPEGHLVVSEGGDRLRDDELFAGKKRVGVSAAAIVESSSDRSAESKDAPTPWRAQPSSYLGSAGLGGAAELERRARNRGKRLLHGASSGEDSKSSGQRTCARICFRPMGMIFFVFLLTAARMICGAEGAGS